MTASTLLLVVAYLGFISLGLPDPVAGVAWPSLRATFDLEQSSFAWIFIGLGCGYCASGFCGGALTNRLGLGNLLWISSALVAAAMFATGLTPTWGIVFAAAVVWGLGSGGIDAGLNAFAAQHFSARHMNWLHACYSLGATLGPLLMTAVLAAAAAWRVGYLIVGGLLAAMALLFLATRRRWDDPQPATNDAAPQTVTLRTALGEPLVGLQSLVFFLYVGVEFTVGQWSFTLLTESRGVGADAAGAMTASYYGAIGVGRVAFGAAAQRVGLDRLLRGALATALVGTAVLAWAPTSAIAAAALVVTGLGLAPVFPCLMTRTPQRLGPALSAHAVGFQVSAGMIGAAVVPSCAGWLAERHGLEAIAVFAPLFAAALVAVHEVVVRLGERRLQA